MGPEVGVAMDDGTFRNIEDFTYGDGEKSECAELGVILKIIIFVSAYKNRASLQSSQAFECRGSVTFRICPFILTIKMIMGDHSLPEGSDLVIR